MSATQLGLKHGDCKRYDNGFDSDLCTCGCSKIQKFVTAKEIAGFRGDEAVADIRALSHARSVNARANLIAGGSKATGRIARKCDWVLLPALGDSIGGPCGALAEGSLRFCPLHEEQMLIAEADLAASSYTFS
jgi:hypothetical protein